jgi:hypothetical protein
MNHDRNTAKIVGALYIVGTVTGIFSAVCTQSIFTAPDLLSQAAAQRNQLVIGMLFVLTMGLSLAMVPVLLYPILKKDHPILALGYVVFRGALETTVYIITAVCWLFLLVVSQEYAAAGAGSAPYLQTLGSVLAQGSDVISSVLVIVFSLDALMLYTMLYQSRLVPRWIPVWGFIAILMHFSTAFLALFGILDGSFSPVLVLVNIPILVQEMVMAVWLILKGFSFTSHAATQPKSAAGLA